MATEKVDGEEMDVRVAVERDGGDYQTFRRWLVVEDAAGDFLPES